MARAGLDERTPLAAATLMLAANAPDIDIFIMFAGQYDDARTSAIVDDLRGLSALLSRIAAAA